MFSQANLKRSGCTSIVIEVAGVNFAWNMIYTTMLSGITSRAKTSNQLVSRSIPVGENKSVFSAIQKLPNTIKFSRIWNKDVLFLGGRLRSRSRNSGV